ncbi:hypothetical protein SAMN05880570_4670 [Paenibacillus sp. RU4T]|uniref:hypothetical protein n=1 Tax=unclassified Paenibacillus TaxID=185978 RepID=UPI0009554E37|nr:MULTISPECIES: hypothetical protein [unclassified Paenibacillus]SIR67088.1 hypothetical protein SAMN05880555_4668 [Paenibacillus sp. RU4X]SIR74911.1 hypothetical protein SAMN05880570_4670 [Paenibacillus sp. RU4T]
MARRRNTLILLTAVILFLLLLLYAFYFVKPAFDKSADMDGEIAQQERLTEVLRKKLAEKQIAADTRPVDGVQGALPYWDNTEQLALDLERIGAEAKVGHASLSFTGDLSASEPLLERSGTAAGTGNVQGAAGSDGAAPAASASSDPLAAAAEGQTASPDGAAQDQAGQAQAAAAGPRKLQVAAVIKGSYKSILAYVEQVNLMERITTVDSLEIARGAAGSEAGRELTVNFAFTAYFDPSYRSQVEDARLPYAESSAPSQ